MAKAEYTLEKKSDYGPGEPLCLVKKEAGKPDDVMASVEDLENLFDTCVRRWKGNWNLEKLLTAIRESEID